MRVLTFDFGRNFGDNWRGLILLKSLKAARPECHLTWWVTPELFGGIAGVIDRFCFIDEVLVEPRPPRLTYEINAGIIKQIIASGKPFGWNHFPTGTGPQGEVYDRVVPTGEPWLTWKLLQRQDLEALEEVNQGEILRRFLDLTEDQVAAAVPLLGQREAVDDSILVGFCRPDPLDKKQVSRTRIDRLWRAVLTYPGPIVQVDYQDWYPPPDARVKDARKLGWAEKVPLFNRARLFIGLDGGLNHFAAACGTPTLSFYGHDPSGRQGPIFGPYPSRTRFGQHRYLNDFKSFEEAIRSISSPA